MTFALPTFQDRGACRDHDPELFFPVSEAEVNAEQIAQAKAVCMSCPVLVDCRAFALAHGPEGIWGGMTESERRAVRLRDNQTAAVAQTDTDQDNAPEPEPAPALPSYEAARQQLARARQNLTRAEQRLEAAEQQFAAVRSQRTTGAVA